MESMFFVEGVISVATLVLVFLELIKLIAKPIARLIKKDPTFDFTFPPLFFTIATPILAALMPFVMVWLGIEVNDPVLTMPFANVVQYLLRILIATLIEFWGFYNAVKPAKDASKLARQIKG